ncbi:hypothetical protein BH24ACT19_BH24ACT19_10880 [soil metagenome]
MRVVEEQTGYRTIAVFGGVYNNALALEAVIRDAKERGAGALYCLGDLGGYGPHPDSVWAPLVEHDVKCIAGNYDISIREDRPDCGCGYTDERDNLYAQVAYDYTRENTSDEFKEWMNTFPDQILLTMGGKTIRMVHGSPFAVNEFLWESTPDDVLGLRLNESGTDLLLCTHTGLHWQREINGRKLVNVGAIGRPANDGRTEVWYAILREAEGGVEAEFVPVAYDHEALADQMREEGLPEPFVETILTGWWTSCLEVLPPYERSKGRFHLYREAAEIEVGESVSWGDAASLPDDGRNVVSIFGTPLFPAHLWVYTNYDCNYSCGYCSVGSNPRVARRSIGVGRFERLIGEARELGFKQLYLTGGETFLLPELGELLEIAVPNIPTTVLTNATLFRGKRREVLERFAGEPNFSLQVSVDGGIPELHDAYRGPGSWKKAMEGIRLARSLGVRVRVGATEAPENEAGVPVLREMLGGLGVAPEDHIVRPLIKRGESDEGMEIEGSMLVQELTVSSEGVAWHPAGVNVAGITDLLISREIFPLRRPVEYAVERFLEYRQLDGSLPRAYHCA